MCNKSNYIGFSNCRVEYTHKYVWNLQLSKQPTEIP